MQTSEDGKPSHDVGGHSDPPKASLGASPLLAVLIAVSVVVGAVTGWFLTTQRTPDTPEIAVLAAEDVTADAIATLNPASQKEAQKDACKLGLSVITVSTPFDPAGATVTFRTSKYRTPPIHVTDTQQRIAIPRPVPDSGGYDPLVVEGDSKPMLVSIYPTLTMQPGTIRSTATIRWLPRPPCK